MNTFFYHRRKWVLLLDLLLLLVSLAAFHRTSVRAKLPMDVLPMNGALYVRDDFKVSDRKPACLDQVISVNGQTVDSRREIEFLTNGMPVGSTAVLEVERAGRRWDMRVPLVRFHPFQYLMVQGLVGLLFLAVGLLLFLKRPADHVAGILHLTFLLVGLMILTTPGRYPPPLLAFSRVIDIFFDAAASFAPVLLLHFSLLFPRPRVSAPATARFIKWLYGAAAVLTLWLSWNTLSLGYPGSWTCYHRYVDAYSYSRWFLCVCVTASVGLMVRSGFTATGDMERRQMRWILLGLATGPFIWAATWQIPILLGWEPLVSEEVSLAILATVPLVFAIAIIQYRFMDVDVVMRRGMVAALAGGVAAAAWAINSSVLASVTAALMVAMLFEGQERERLNRMKSFFVSGVSHDLKTPLTGIKMYTQMLRTGKKTSPALRRKYLRIIEGETDRLARLVDNVLSFSRMERGRREYRFVPSELNGLTRATLKSLDYPVRMGGFRLRKTFCPGPLRLKCDPDALGEALANLLANSLKYSGARKELAVSTLSAGDMVGVRVQDWGIGIPPEEQARIFEPYYRSPREKALQTGGAGLGLALVKSIVDAHGGNVDLVSIPGQGSVFTLWFPRMVDPTRAAR